MNPRPTGGGAISSPPLVFLRYILNQCRYHHQTCITLSPNIFTHCVKILKSRVPDMCHGKKSRSKILKVPCQVYISGSWVPRSRVKYTFQDPGFPRSHDKCNFQDPGSQRSHNLDCPRSHNLESPRSHKYTFQDPESPRSHDK